MEKSFKLIVFSAEKEVPNETAMVNELFHHGLETFHLRKPGWSGLQMQNFLEAISDKFHNKIILHSHFQLTEKFNLKGIHLNEENKKQFASLTQFNIISASFHSLQDIKENTFHYQYVFLSPVFNSISKAGYTAKFDFSLLQKELGQIALQTKVIALGGITIENILSVRNTGFAGAAAVGAIWESKNPIDAFLQIKSAVESN